MKKNRIISILVSLFLIGITYYIFLPAINPTTISFWTFLTFAIVVVWFNVSISSMMSFNLDFRRLRDIPKFSLVCFTTIFVIVVGTVVINFFVGPFFNAHSYAKRIEVVDGVFKDDVMEVDFSKVPLLDKNSSEKVGDRIMGQYSEYVSQFYVSDEYTQINYNDEIVRVTPLEYEGFIKWLTRRP